MATMGGACIIATQFPCVYDAQHLSAKFQYKTVQINLTKIKYQNYIILLLINDVICHHYTMQLGMMKDVDTFHHFDK